MSRSWRLSSLFSKFWFHALKRAAEVSNYLPLTVNDTLTTPFKLAYKQKPDLHNILPLFSVSYVSEDQEIQQRTDWHFILHDDASKQLEFYHPPTRQLLYSDDFVFDSNLCPGPTFNLDYDDGLYLHKCKDYHDEDNITPYPPNYQMFALSSRSPDTYTTCKILRMLQQIQKVK